MNNQSIIIAFSLESSSDFATSYWLKMEQVGIKSDAATLSDTASVLDATYGTEPCIATKKDENTPSSEAGKDGASTTTTITTSGSSPTTTTVTMTAPDDSGSGDSPPMDEDKFNDTAGKILDMNTCKNNDGCYPAQLRVYRSHQNEPYKLIFDNGKITQTSYKTAEANESPAISNASGYNLAYPLFGDLQCGWKSARNETGETLIPPPEISVDGSTLKWGINVTGILDIQYTTEFDLIDILVSKTTGLSVSGELTDQTVMGIPGGINLNNDTTMPDCHVLAYYHRMIYTQDIKAPVVDPTTTETEKRRFCLKSMAGVNTNDHIQTCFEQINHIYLCKCSNFESTASWEEERDVPCPDYVKHDSGRFIMGTKNIYDGTSDCGEEDAVHDPYYYHYVCCKWPDEVHVILPKCVESQDIYSGGKGLSDSVKEEYIDEYGPNTQFVGIGPDHPPCGFTITRQVTTKHSCCDLATPIVWDYTQSVNVIGDYSNGVVYVSGGVSPYKWKITGGQGFGFDPLGNIKQKTTQYPMVKVYTGDACGTAAVHVTDDCSEAVGYLRATSGQWVPVQAPDICSGASGNTYGTWNTGYRYKSMQRTENQIGYQCNPSWLGPCNTDDIAATQHQIAAYYHGNNIPCCMGPPKGVRGDGIEFFYGILPDSKWDGYQWVYGISCGQYSLQEWIC